MTRPAVLVVEVAEDVRRDVAEEIDRGAGRTASRGGTRATSTAAGTPPQPVEDLDDVGEVDEPRGHDDLVALGALGYAAAVPALEGLLDRPSGRGVDAEAGGQLVGGSPVVREHGAGVVAASGEEAGGGARPVERAATAAQPAEHEGRVDRGRPKSTVRKSALSTVSSPNHLACS